MLTTSLCIVLCPASGMNTTKIEYFKSQVEGVPFQHVMAELISTEDIETNIVVCSSGPDSDRHLSKKKRWWPL